MRFMGRTRRDREGRALTSGTARVAVGVALCAGLVGGLVSPVWAASSDDDGADAVQLGSFALGDGLEGTISELDGAFGFALSVGGLQLAWDSRAASADPVRLGVGWSLGLTTVRVVGGVWVLLPSGAAYEMDASVPSGLAGYPGSDVVFATAEPGAVVPARSDGSVGETPYAYVLHELGGVSTYFDAAGYPVVRLVIGGDRLDWRWEPGATGRLRAAVTAEGSVTALDWSDPSRLVIEPGSTVSGAPEGSGVGGRWHVHLDGGRVSTVVDPAGGRTRIGYGRHGLVQSVSTPSGASTVVHWRASADGIARVERVRLVDDVAGAELSVREWEVQGEVTPSGWPMASESRAGSAARSAGGSPGYSTSVSDGTTRVRSTVDPDARVTGRAVVASFGSGERVVQEQSFEYPETDGPGKPGGAVKPIAATTTYHDQRGAVRSVSETYDFDAFGRMTARTAVDGSTTRLEYDDEIPAGRSLPVGLVVEETTTAPDGLVVSTRSELSEDRAAVVVAEQWSGRVSGDLIRTGRVEAEVEHGFVTEKRVFPDGDPAAVPVVSRWSKETDLSRGTRTVVQTVAAGTGIEAATTSVSSLVHGATLSEIDEVGNVTSAQYDRVGRQVLLEDDAGRWSRSEYRTRQVDGVNAVTVTDHTGVAVTETRDVLGRVTRKSDTIAPSGRAVAGFERVFATADYETLGVERVTDAWGAVTTTESDVFGRTERVTLPNGVVQVAEYDDVAGTATSGVSLTGDLADAELTFMSTLDTAGRVTRSTGTRADGEPVPARTAEFDGFGREARSGDELRSTTTEYDVAGNAVALEVQPVAGAPGEPLTAEREYDAFGVSVAKTLRSDTEVYAGHRRELDELGRVVSQTDQRGSIERISYTPDGLVAEVASGTGRVATYEYDPASRALVGTRVTSPHGAVVATSFRHDAAGRLIAVFDPADEPGTAIEYEHDDFGNVIRVGYPDGSEIRHEFDPHGRKIATIDVARNRTSFSYAPDGSMLAAAQVDADGTPVSSARYGYDGYGRVNAIERANGVRTEFAFTSTAEVETEVTTGPDGVRSEREYTYAGTGLLTTRVDRIRDDAGRVQTTRADYEYDAHDRLIGSTVREGGAPTGRVRTRAVYEPTIGGDLASETVTTDPDTAGSATTTRVFEYSEVGELIAITTDGQRRGQEFDADGNLLAATTGTRYEYDAAGRPVAQTSSEGVRIDTTYWADGHRREHTTESGTTRTYWDGDRLINDVHLTGADEPGTASYLIGTSRHARSIRAGDGAAVTSYYGTDRHGNVTDLTDQAGATITTYAYTDYGVPTIAGDRSEPLPAGIGELGYNPFQYAGEYTYRDGTQSLGARTYDPLQARFTSKDDAPLANRYAYADLNPITNVDPTGHDAQKDWLNAVAAIGGFMIALIGGLIMITTPGLVFTALGVIGVAVAVGEAVLAAVHIVETSLSKDTFDDDAIEIASWAFFATSVLVGIGGGVATWVGRGGSIPKLTSCFRLFNCADGGGALAGSTTKDGIAALRQILGWKDWLVAADVDHLHTLAVKLGDAKLLKHVGVVQRTVHRAKDIAQVEARTMRDFTHGAMERTEEAVNAVHRTLSDKLGTAHEALVKAESRLNLLAGVGGEHAQTARDALTRVTELRTTLSTQIGMETPVPSPILSRNSPDPSEYSPLLIRESPTVSQF
jgi:RHS repeat-associated protein